MGLQASGATVNRTYNGTDTRIDALMIGAALAFIPDTNSWRTALARSWIVPAIWLLLTAFLISSWEAEILHGPGFTLSALAFGWLLLASMTSSQRVLAAALSAAPMQWLGRRSYSLYLWHYPLLSLMAFHNISAPVIALGISLLVADLSYRYVEKPFLSRPPAARLQAPAL